MASRRLTISSLLCDDDSPDSPHAGPSTVLAHKHDLAESYAYTSAPHRADYASPYVPQLNPLPAVRDPVPFSHLPRRTPSPVLQPDQPVSIAPSLSRRSFKEIAFDDYRPASSSIPASFGGVPEHDTRHPSPDLAPVRYSHSRTAIDALIHKPQSYSPQSYSPPSYSPPSYSPPDSASSHYTSRPDPPPLRITHPDAHLPSTPEPLSSTHHLRSPSHSPLAAYSPSHRPPSRSPLLSATSSAFYSHSYSPFHHRPSQSPLQPPSPPVPTPFASNPDPPYARSPMMDTHYSPKLAKPTLSALLTHSPHSPSVGRSSASSLPHILNSPVMSRTQGMNYSAGMNSTISPGMEALEALAEVAARERKRVQGDVDEIAETGMTATSPTPYSSPKVARRDFDVDVGITNDDSGPVTRPSPAVAARSPTRSPVAERAASVLASPVVQPPTLSARSSPDRDVESHYAPASPPVDRATTRLSPVVDTAMHTRSAEEPVDGQTRSPTTLVEQRHESVPATSPHAGMSPMGTSLVELVKSPMIVDSVPSRMPTDEEPPAKRRRSSPQSPPVERALETPVAHIVTVVQRPSSPEVHEVVDVPTEIVATPAVVPNIVEPVAQSPPAPFTPVSPRSSVHKPSASPKQEAPKVEILSPVSLDLAEEIPAKMPPPATTPAPATKPKKSKAKEKPEAKKHAAKPKEKDAKPSLAEKPQPQRKPLQGSKQEEDAHEWLLEHYGGLSSPKAQPSGSSKVVASSSVPRATAKHGTNSTSPVVAHPSSASSHSKSLQNSKPKAKTKEARNQTRTPTPLALLEEELDHEEPRRVRERRDEMDVDSELELVVGDVSRHQHEDSADMDVDAELLSLLDDQPHQHPHQHQHQHAHSSSSRQHHPASPVVREPTPHPAPSSGKLTHTSDTRGATSELDSMPPPAGTVAHSSMKNGEAPAAASVATASKKKEPALKAAPKKAATKAKPKPKPKPKAPTKKDGSATPALPVASSSTLNVPTTLGAGRSKKVTPLASGSAAALTAKRAVSTGGGASRSRSTSVMPGADADKEADEEAEAVDDKLYCICKTSYDEDRVMIACDRCDEWYHTSCVDMPDLEVDLVDQFICPVCIAKHPNLLLKTTYKTRCWAGLQHPDPSSSEACHKPSRGAFSKYCSDECGVKYISSRIEQWGGDRRALWEAVKNAEPRQAVVLRVVPEDMPDGVVKQEGAGSLTEPRTEIVVPTKTPAQRELQRLEGMLAKVTGGRDVLAKDQEVLQWRERVVELAAARAERVQECGWDQRLCFGDEEVLEFGAEVLDTYEDDERRGTPDGMQVDGVGEWWCKGKKKCDRHAGWQKLRQAECELERELHDAQLDRLTTQEREIRKQMEGVMDVTAQKPSTGPGPLQPHNGEIQLKVLSKPQPQTNGIEKKGKKRKAEK